MTVQQYRYPGDPVGKCVEYTRQEFLTEHPRTAVTISDLSTGEVLDSFQTPPDAVYCDLCSEDPGNVIFVTYVRSCVTGYCRKCYEETVKPYCRPLSIA